MGMTANYRIINNLEGEAEVLDIDKMWDAMHLLLTGFSMEENSGESILSIAVIGENVDTESDEYIATVSKERVKDVVEALEKFDIAKAADEFSFKKCIDADIHPSGAWEYTDEEDEVKEELKEDFEAILELYKKALAKEKAVTVTII